MWSRRCSRTGARAAWIPGRPGTSRAASIWSMTGLPRSARALRRASLSMSSEGPRTHPMRSPAQTTLAREPADSTFAPRGAYAASRPGSSER